MLSKFHVNHPVVEIFLDQRDGLTDRPKVLFIESWASIDIKKISLVLVLVNNKNSSDLKHRQLACFVNWDVCTEPTPTPASVCSPCCRLTNDTEASTSLPPDYRAASFDSLWDSWTQPQHSTNKLCPWLYYSFFISLYSLRSHFSEAGTKNDLDKQTTAFKSFSALGKNNNKKTRVHTYPADVIFSSPEAQTTEVRVTVYLSDEFQRIGLIDI